MPVISIRYKLLQSSSPHDVCDLIIVQPARSTWSSTLVTLLQPSVDSSLKITNRSFRRAVLVEQTSSYSSCSLSVCCIIITQLFSIVMENPGPPYFSAFSTLVLIPSFLPLCCRNSVCRLSSVCNVGAPYSGGWSFQQNFFTAVYAGHSLTFMQNFAEIVPGEPLRRER